MRPEITSANRQKKVTLVNDVTEKVQKSKGIVFTNYQGLTHQQLEGFKRSIKPLEAEYVVIKNTLMLRSLEGQTLSDADKESFKQPLGTLFMYGDPVEPLKLLSKLIKELKLPVVKFGIMDGRVIDETQVSKLATLPAVNVLRAQLLGQMKAPISGLHRALNWNLQNLVMTLSAIQQKKSN
jgi:large subunit ribosomal protein L10